MSAPKLTGNRCQCPACGEHFTSSRAFDRHRVGAFARPGIPNTRPCQTGAELDAAGFIRNARGFCGEPERARLLATHFEIPAPRSTVAMVLLGGTPQGPGMRTGVTP